MSTRPAARRSQRFGPVGIAAALILVTAALHLRLTLGAGWPGTRAPLPDTACDLAAARSLAHGEGASLPFAWQYLDGVPTSLPTPAFQYRMPLPALLQSVAERVPHASAATRCMPAAIAGALLAAATIGFGFALSRRPLIAILSGCLVGLGFISVRVTMVSPAATWFAVFGSGAAFCISRSTAVEEAGGRWMAAGGVLAGLAFLCRADALALVLTAGIVAVYAAVEQRRHAAGQSPDPKRPVRERTLWVPLSAFAVCFLLIIAPWAAWRARTFGSIVPSGMGRWLAFSSRADTYRVQPAAPADETDVARDRADSVRHNAAFLGVAAGLPWLPFILIDAWRRRKELANLPNYVFLLILFVGHCLVYPAASLGAGFPRAALATLPLLCVAGLRGLAWSVERMGWRWALIPAAAVLSGLHTVSAPWLASRVTRHDAYLDNGLAAATALREARGARQAPAEAAPADATAGPTRGPRSWPAPMAILSDEPATMGYLTGIPAYPIPSDDLATVAEVAAQVGANVMVVSGRYIDRVPGLPEATLSRSQLVQLDMLKKGDDPLFIYDMARLPNAEAIALAQQGDRERAVRILRLALRHVGPGSPGYLPMMRNLGHILLSAGKPDEAMTVLATALAAKPDDAEMLYWWAQTLKALGREREAELALKRVEDLEPGLAKRKEMGALRAHRPAETGR